MVRRKAQVRLMFGLSWSDARLRLDSCMFGLRLVSVYLTFIDVTELLRHLESYMKPIHILKCTLMSLNLTYMPLLY